MRIARDLHDELTPMLTQAFMCVDVCSNRYGAAVADFLAPSKEILGEAINRMADIIKNLDDSRVLERGLKQSVLKVLEQYRELQQLQFTFNYTVKKELPRAVTLGFYRILLELVQNTIKHAHASAIEVQIWEWRSFLFFYYKDNGANAWLPLNPEGTGLKSLQHRIELLGGIYESRRNGKDFQFRIPLKPVKNGSL
ncbi:MAG: hypothetical protein J7539_17530 [Niabella sp.]|nr:hypothetical protein [Niabella sp.]